MASHRKKAVQEQNDVALQNYKAGYSLVNTHPLFSVLLSHVHVYRHEYITYPEHGLAFVEKKGHINCNPKLRARPEEWARAIAHCLLHLAMEHFRERERPIEWNIACDCVVEKFLSDLKFGSPLSDNALPTGINDEERLYNLKSRIMTMLGMVY